jgi:transcription initiation factor IIF auxiliary subunit
MGVVTRKKLISLSLRNKWHYKGEDWWDWEAFIDDHGSGQLSSVDHVEYVLHPTFREPIRKISDRKDGFRLKTSGWGTFMLKAFVHMKSGQKLKLEHILVLEQNPPDGTSN